MNYTAASRSVDKMNGIGMPILFIFFLLLTVCLTGRLVLRSFRAAFSDTALLVCFCGSLLNIFLSIFLYFSTAFNYGVMTTVLSFALLCFSSREGVRRHAVQLLFIYLIWFFIVVGIPTSLNFGIINATNRWNCVAFYNTFAETMCRDGWLTVVKIAACLVIGLTLVPVLVLSGEVFGATNGPLTRETAEEEHDSK